MKLPRRHYSRLPGSRHTYGQLYEDGGRRVTCTDGTLRGAFVLILISNELTRQREDWGAGVRTRLVGGRSGVELDVGRREERRLLTNAYTRHVCFRRPYTSDVCLCWLMNWGHGVRWLHDSVASAGSYGRGRAWSCQGSFAKLTAVKDLLHAIDAWTSTESLQFFRFSDSLSRSQLF